MNFQHCQKCNKQFSRKEISKSTSNLLFRPKIECSNCGEAYKITTASYVLLIIIRLITMALFVVWFYTIFNAELPFYIYIMFALLVFTLAIFIEPIAAKFKLDI